jgi:hypothetical protein
LRLRRSDRAKTRATARGQVSSEAMASRVFLPLATRSDRTQRSYAGQVPVAFLLCDDVSALDRSALAVERFVKAGVEGNNEATHS